MGYKWDIVFWEGRREVKEMKIRINPALQRQLRMAARRSLRSMNQQVIAYIERGLKAEREPLVPAREEARKAVSA